MNGSCNTANCNVIHSTLRFREGIAIPRNLLTAKSIKARSRVYRAAANRISRRNKHRYCVNFKLILSGVSRKWWWDIMRRHSLLYRCLITTASSPSFRVANYCARKMAQNLFRYNWIYGAKNRKGASLQNRHLFFANFCFEKNSHFCNFIFIINWFLKKKKKSSNL